MKKWIALLLLLSLCLSLCGCGKKKEPPAETGQTSEYAVPTEYIPPVTQELPVYTRFDSIEILHNNCCFYGDVALCGTRGWSCDAADGDDHDQKILRRELMRLETSLKAAGEREKLVFLHYPPKLVHCQCDEVLELLHAYGVRRCWYGHLHSGGCALGFEGDSEGIRFQMISADHLHFFPQKIF